jgi:large subunit ribosomal protein L29
MSNKRIKELRDLSPSELGSKAREIEEGLFRARLNKATGQLSDKAMVWRMRKDLARVKTLITAKSSKA